MCWKRYEPDPQPSPTPMAVFVSTFTDELHGIGNATEGGSVCPETATECSNITSSTIHCNNGFCCERTGSDPFCSCESGWEGSECDIISFAESVLGEDSSSRVIIGVLVAVFLVGLFLAIVFFVHRKLSRNRRNENSTRETSRSLPLSDLKVDTNSASKSLLRTGKDTNGNDEGALTFETY